MDDVDTKLIEKIRKMLAHEKETEEGAIRELLISMKELKGTVKSQEEICKNLLMRIEGLENSLTPLLEQLKKL